MKNSGLLIGAEKLVNICAGVKDDEEVLVITDTLHIEIAQELIKVLEDRDIEYTLAVMKPRTTHGENPTEAIAKAMLGVDVVFAPTKYSLSHSRAREEANEAGVRFLSLPDYNMEMLKGGAIEADFIELAKVVEALGKLLDSAEIIDIKSENGTDIKLQVKNRTANRIPSLCIEKGVWGCPPNIEVNISPIEEAANGKIVVDGSIPIPQIGVVKDTPVTLTVENGRIISFEGGERAKLFKEVLEGFDDENSFIIAELGIGLNPKAKISGSFLEDEGAYGTIHFGWGHNLDQGGRIKASSHIDTVIMGVDMYIDGKLTISKGRLVDYDLKGWENE